MVYGRYALILEDMQESMGSAYRDTVCNFFYRAWPLLKSCYKVASYSEGAKLSAGYYLRRGSVSYGQWSHINALAWTSGKGYRLILMHYLSFKTRHSKAICLN